MSSFFLLLAAILATVAALLCFAADRRLLNFVDYGDARAVRRVNRYASARMLFPVLVNLGCAWVAGRRPDLAVPLLFLTPLSILGTAVWVASAAGRLRAQTEAGRPAPGGTNPGMTGTTTSSKQAR